MNEKEMIKKLKLLTKLAPCDKSITRMRVMVLRNIAEEENSSFLPRYKDSIQRQYIFISLFSMVVLIGILSFPYVQKNIQPIVFTTKIALASNHYEKAKVSFQEAQLQFAEVQASPKISVESLMATTLATQQYITKLHLNGEKGKYTQEQCKILHQEYLGYLKKLKNQLKQEEYLGYAARITEYQQQVTNRLAFYKS